MNLTRSESRLAFARQATRTPDLQLESASSDASFRSYWRSLGITPSRIVMDAPPGHEDLGPWLQIGELLRTADVHAPEVFERDLDNGFLLLGDLGRRTLLPELAASTVDRHYANSLNTLLRMQTAVDASSLPPYDEHRLTTEMELLPTWFLREHLGIVPECEQWDVIESAFRSLLDNAAAQPKVFVHRDYHARNLMLLDDGGLGVIDFQDAVRGPVTYDLVSILRDCYIEWPDAQVEAWVEGYREQLRAAGIGVPDAARFLRWFDLMGLQRHIKVLGIFCRLWYRDGKAGYLGDLPRVWSYTRRIGRKYEETRPLIELLEDWIGARDLCQPREPAHIAQPTCAR